MDVIAWWRELQWPGTQVSKCDGVQLLAQMQSAGMLDEETLVYADPPYLMSTRSKKQIYKFEWRAKDHDRFLSVAKSLDCRVMISGYDSPKYNKGLRRWEKFTHEAMTRGGTTRTECCWCNFNPATLPPVHPLDGAALGDDYRERERVKKLLTRWRHNLNRRPSRERHAIRWSLLVDR